MLESRLFSKDSYSAEYFDPTRKKRRPRLQRNRSKLVSSNNMKHFLDNHRLAWPLFPTKTPCEMVWFMWASR
jgi:hypothetical protein